MAGDWIKIEHALPSKPEVMQMAASLGCNEMEVVGHLVCFWSWVDQNMSAKCPVVTGTKSGLDRVAGRTGFADAMIDVGWLTISGANVSVPNYEDHLSKSSKARALEAKRKRIARESPGQEPDTKPDMTRTESALEERREEENNNTPHKPPKGGVPQWLDEAFSRWWSSYPKKVSKQNAVRAYPKAIKKIEAGEGVPRERAVEVLQEAVEAFAASDAGKGDYVPHPATWLNGGRWEDDRATWKDSAGSKPVSERVPRIEDYQNGHMWNPHE